MKKKFILLLCLSIALTVLLAAGRDYGSLQPHRSKAAFTNISRISADAQGAVYAIANSKRSLLKIDAEGVLIYETESNRDALEDTVQLYNSVAADEQGNAYVLLTILDSFGLKVSGERIIRLSPDGKKQTVLYEVEYPA